MSKPEHFDNTQAMSEGWAISACTGVDEKWRLERIDEDEKFADDFDAWGHVGREALKGSIYHIRALKFLEVNEPIEFFRVEDYVCFYQSVNSLSALFRHLTDEDTDT